jgi:hypothetical protein
MYILLSDHQSFIIIVVEKWAQSIVSFNLYSRYANSLLCFDCDGVLHHLDLGIYNHCGTMKHILVFLTM